MCFIRAYLRASTDEQDASRARGQVEAFAAERGMQIASWYLENESGAKLARSELFRLLGDSHPGDVLLVEQVDRLSRLGAADWDRLKVELAARKVRVVALDLPTSWTMATTGKVNDFTARMFEAINGMLLDMLAAVARKDYEDRRCRQMQGQAKAKAEGKSSAARRIRSATPRSRPCCGLARPTALYRMQPAAAARRSPRSRSAISGSLNQIASGRILAAVRLTAAPRCAREAAADSARVALSERRIYDESIG